MAAAREAASARVPVRAGLSPYALHQPGSDDIAVESWYPFATRPGAGNVCNKDEDDSRRVTRSQPQGHL